ncbi:MAG TPA: response regulator transcription factor [Candidatus Paceibacterota bacterium]
MKVLLVEDNEKLSSTLKHALLQEGYAVDCLFDGDDAYRRITVSKNDYDVVILDRMLPSMEGVEVCRRWRDEGITVPVIMLTALDGTEEKVTGLTAGADDYLAKPFSFEELLARIRAVLRRPPQMVNTVLEVDGVLLDATSRTVTHHGENVTLTLKEFMVLEYLMRNASKVVTRDALYDHAWDFADSSFSNTVDVHIKNLRKKLHDEGILIQTIRGVGYKMGA